MDAYMWSHIPQASVALGVLAALLEDLICAARPKSVRGNWSYVVSRGLQPPLTTTYRQHQTQPTTTHSNNKYNIKVEWLGWDRRSCGHARAAPSGVEQERRLIHHIPCFNQGQQNRSSVRLGALPAGSHCLAANQRASSTIYCRRMLGSSVPIGVSYFAALRPIPGCSSIA